MVAMSSIAVIVGGLAVLGAIAYDGGDGAAPAGDSAGGAAAGCGASDMACEAEGAIRTAERLAAGTLHAAADGAVVAAGLADEAIDVAADIGRDAAADVRQSQSGMHSPIGQFARLNAQGP